MSIGHCLAILAAVLSAFGFPECARAQLDPIRRDVVEFGYDRPLQGHVPFAGYAFDYLNRPAFGDPDHVVTVVLSPVYVSAQYGIRNALGPNTDVAFGLDGGGYVNTYNEIREGRWFRDESFLGHGGGATLGAFHLFNPGSRIPFNSVAIAGLHELVYERYSDTSSAFRLPKDQPLASLRAGVRFGGMEPVLRPDLAGELSLWYESDFRLASGPYGFNDDRRVEPSVHLFWGRALLKYTIPSSGHRFSFNVDGGTSINPDRLSAYRIGGMGSLGAEFPLLLPGYQSGELSAKGFVLTRGSYWIPIDRAREWELGAGAGVAHIAYTPGVPQFRATNKGIDVELDYRPGSRRWKTALVYGHGFDAVRNGHRGADSVTLLMELDLEKIGWVASAPAQ